MNSKILLSKSQNRSLIVSRKWHNSKRTIFSTPIPSCNKANKNKQTNALNSQHQQTSDQEPSKAIPNETNRKDQTFSRFRKTYGRKKAIIFLPHTQTNFTIKLIARRERRNQLLKRRRLSGSNGAASSPKHHCWRPEMRLMPDSRLGRRRSPPARRKRYCRMWRGGLEIWRLQLSHLSKREIFNWHIKGSKVSKWFMRLKV